MVTHRTAQVLPLAVLAMLCCCVVPCHTKDGPLPETDDYPYHAQLDENYSLQWRFNSTHIMFHARVKAKGYVGLGLSRNGDMSPGDMVIAWTDTDGVNRFHDRHAKHRVVPVIDSKQDWNLVHFKIEGGKHTVMTVIRKLNTCDEDEDISIERGTTRVIFAYSNDVARSDQDILYHGPTNRGSKSLLLLDPPPMDRQNRKLPDDVITVDFFNDNYQVPGVKTTYACVVRKFPQLDGKHHMIRYEPIIKKGNEKLVHHFVLYYCKQPVADRHLNHTGVCFVEEPQEIAGICDYSMIAWAIGGSAFDYPTEAGFSLGGPGDPIYFRFETHYDNPGMKTDFVDNSGLRMYLTKDLRKHDAGLLEVGALINKNHIIPPGYPDFLTKAYCPSACLDKGLGDKEIRVFADFLHSHLMGLRIATRHVRDGLELPPILKDDFYDSDYQETRALTEERVVKKGDMLMTDCYYDSTTRKTVTYGGLGTREEMCISFLLYYPRIELTDCFTEVVYTKQSKPMYPGPGGVSTFVNTTDWSSAEARQQFVNNVKTSDVVDHCIFETTRDQIPSSQPKEFQQYVQEDVCKPNSGSGVGGSTRTMSILLLLLLSIYRLTQSD